MSGGRFAAGERERRGKREKGKWKRGIGEGKEGGKGREEGREGKGKEEGKGEEREFASLALGGIDAPVARNCVEPLSHTRLSPIIWACACICFTQLFSKALGQRK